MEVGAPGDGDELPILRALVKSAHILSRSARDRAMGRFPSVGRSRAPGTGPARAYLVRRVQ